MARVLALVGVLALGAIVAGAVSAQDDYGYGYGTPTETTASPPPAPSPSGSAPKVSTYRSPLSAAQEVPKPKARAGAKGSFTATITHSGTAITLKWKLTFAGLSGKAVAAHIHKGKRGKAGPVVLALCGPCRSGQKGSTKLAESVDDAIESGVAYVNVHTARNAAGEIRGQLIPKQT
jgi:hypothetical protein